MKRSVPQTFFLFIILCLLALTTRSLFKELFASGYTIMPCLTDSPEDVCEGASNGKSFGEGDKCNLLCGPRGGCQEGYVCQGTCVKVPDSTPVARCSTTPISLGGQCIEGCPLSGGCEKGLTCHNGECVGYKCTNNSCILSSESPLSLSECSKTCVTSDLGKELIKPLPYEPLKEAIQLNSSSFITTICGVHPFGPSLARLTPELLKAAYFEEFALNDFMPLQTLLRVISYGTIEFTKENNLIHPNIIPLTIECSAHQVCMERKKQNPESKDKCLIRCDDYTWFREATSKDNSQNRNNFSAVFFPENIDCPFSGNSRIVFRGMLDSMGMAHEIMHNRYYIGHSASICNVIPGVNSCAETNCCDDKRKGVNTVGDLTCLMGYGPGKHLNVAQAHNMLQCIEPIRVINRAEVSGDVNITITTIQKTNKNFVRIHNSSNQERSYYVSYNMSKDPLWYKGFFDPDERFANRVLIHVWEPSIRVSTLIGVLSPGAIHNVTFPFKVGRADPKLDNFKVTFKTGTGTSADVTISV